MYAFLKNSSNHCSCLEVISRFYRQYLCLLEVQTATELHFSRPLWSAKGILPMLITMLITLTNCLVVQPKDFHRGLTMLFAISGQQYQPIKGSFWQDHQEPFISTFVYSRNNQGNLHLCGNSAIYRYLICGHIYTLNGTLPSAGKGALAILCRYAKRDFQECTLYSSMHQRQYTHKKKIVGAKNLYQLFI